MAFEKRTPQPYAVLRRGQKETEMLYFYDKPQFRQSNGIYAEVKEADITGLTAQLDAKVQSYRLATGDVQKDKSFVPMADSTINDAKGKVLTINFDTGVSASIYVPMVLNNKVDDLATKFGGFAWVDKDGTALKCVSIDYKATKSFVTAPTA